MVSTSTSSEADPEQWLVGRWRKKEVIPGVSEGSGGGRKEKRRGSSGVPSQADTCGGIPQGPGVKPHPKSGLAASVSAHPSPLVERDGAVNFQKPVDQRQSSKKKTNKRTADVGQRGLSRLPGRRQLMWQTQPFLTPCCCPKKRDACRLFSEWLSAHYPKTKD